MFQYDQDWQVYDIIKEVKRLTKTARSFKLSEAKVVKLTSNKLYLNEAYSGQFKEHTVLKRGQSFATYNPPLLEPESYVKEAKKADVRSLLADLGVGPEIAASYEQMLSAGSNGADNESDSD